MRDSPVKKDCIHYSEYRDAEMHVNECDFEERMFSCPCEHDECDKYIPRTKVNSAALIECGRQDVRSIDDIAIGVTMGNGNKKNFHFKLKDGVLHPTETYLSFYPERSEFILRCEVSAFDMTITDIEYK